MKPPKPTTRTANSPLYTSPAGREAKAAFIRRFGRDKDGAFRTTRRTDGEPK